MENKQLLIDNLYSFLNEKEVSVFSSGLFLEKTIEGTCTSIVNTYKKSIQFYATLDFRNHSFNKHNNPQTLAQNVRIKVWEMLKLDTVLTFEEADEFRDNFDEYFNKLKLPIAEIRISEENVENIDYQFRNNCIIIRYNDCLNKEKGFIKISLK